MRPRSDTELLPVLLELIGSKIPVSQWPTQLNKSQRTEHAREVTQARSAEADRPATTPAESKATQEQATALQWPQRALQAQDSIDAERRRRREAAVSVAPKLPPPLGSSFRERNVFLLPEDDETDEEEHGGGPAGRG